MKSIDEVKKEILSDIYLNDLKEVFKYGESYLVGGFIRDLFLGEKSLDRDIVTKGSSFDLAKKITEKTGGTFIELDSENEIYRVVLPDKSTYFDVSRALDDDFLKDAKRRDFTLNAIFFDLNKEEFFDPTEGIEALNDGILATHDIKNLSDDPLRMLRAFRFMAIYNFKIAEDILNYTKNNFKDIEKCAGERKNVEIMKLFGGEFAYSSLVQMDKTVLLEEIFPFVKEVKKIPKNTHHHLDLFHHLLETMNFIDKNKPLLRLAAFMHDIGKPKCHMIEPNGRHRFIGHDEIGSKLVPAVLSPLKFSKKQVEFVTLMVKYHIYPSSLMATQAASQKAKIRFVRRLCPYVEDIIELARADRLAARGELVTEDMVRENLKNLAELLEFYYEIKPRLERLPKLLDGREIMEILNIKAGPILGKIIDELKEAQIAKTVNNKEEAAGFIKRIYVECKEM